MRFTADLRVAPSPVSEHFGNNVASTTAWDAHYVLSRIYTPTT